jgi:ABC-2 type transport system permease protein
MAAALRYLRLFAALARYGLARELAFRGNFLVKISVELIWLFLLIVFYKTVFARTSVVAGWSEAEYLFFVGCHFALGGVVETFFLSNCGDFADLVRSGDLDFYLLKPIDEQFLITCKSVDWATAPNVLVGVAVMGFALRQLGWRFDAAQAGLFLLLFACGVGLAYSFLVVLTATSVWMVRNQSLYEVWWLFSTLMRYPSDIFVGYFAYPLGLFFMFVVPVMLVVNVPARVMVKALEPGMVGFMLLATALLLALSRRFFRAALRRYRSASS